MTGDEREKERVLLYNRRLHCFDESEGRHPDATPSPMLGQCRSSGGTCSRGSLGPNVVRLVPLPSTTDSESASAAKSHGSDPYNKPPTVSSRLSCAYK